MIMNSTGHMEMSTGTHMDHSNMNNMNTMNNMDNMDNMNMNMNMNSTKCGEGMMGMMMYFHTGHCEHVLFKELLVSTAGQMVGACVAIFILALLYEGLKVFREHLLRQSLTPNYNNQVTISKYSQSQDTMVIDPQSAKANGQKSHEYLANGMDYRNNHKDEMAGTRMISTAHFIQTVLHIMQVCISYCLMLAFMTYNVWLCLAVILGAGTGYFMFGWKRAIVVDVNEHCH